MSDKRYIRLKPYNPKVGHIVKRYHVRGKLFLGEDGNGISKWYVVDKGVADELALLHQIHSDTSTPYLFEVCDEEQYNRIATTERNAKLYELGLASQAASAQGFQPVSKPEPAVRVTAGRSDALVEERPQGPAPIEVEEVSGAGEVSAEIGAATVEEVPSIEAVEVESAPAAEVSEPKPAPKKRRGRPKKS